MAVSKNSLYRYNFLWTIILLCSISTTFSCRYKGSIYKDQETWIERSTFVIKCHISQSGWRTEITGCLTAQGVIMQPGQTLHEMNMTYECRSLPSGRVEIRKTYDLKSSIQTPCDGRKIGESWVENVNIQKRCTVNGIVIENCLTNTGIPIKVNQTLSLGSIFYKCIEQNGVVTVERENRRRPSDSSNTEAPPHLSELLGVDSKRLKEVSQYITEEPETSMKQVVAASRTKEEGDGMACQENGRMYKINETWPSQSSFTKKCNENGSIDIVNCIIDENSFLSIGSEITKGDVTYKCAKIDKNGFVYLERRLVSSN